MPHIAIKRTFLAVAAFGFGAGSVFGGTADGAFLRKAVLDAVRAKYYRALDGEQLERSSLPEILELLDKDSSLVEPPSKGLDYVRGFKRHRTVSGPRLMGRGIGVLRIEYFSGSTLREFKKAYEGLRGSGASKFVFDLRGNPGGDFESAVGIAELFVQEGKTLAVLSKKEEKKVYRSKNPGPYRGPVAVLVDNGTASAAELLAMTLEKEGARTVGVSTQGKRTVQQVLPVEGKWLSLTVGTWTAEARSGSVEGPPVTPEFAIDDREQQMEKALELLKD